MAAALPLIYLAAAGPNAALPADFLDPAADADASPEAQRMVDAIVAVEGGGRDEVLELSSIGVVELPPATSTAAIIAMTADELRVLADVEVEAPAVLDLTSEMSEAELELTPAMVEQPLELASADVLASPLFASPIPIAASFAVYAAMQSTGTMRRRVPGEDETGLNEIQIEDEMEPGDADETLIEGRRRPGVPQQDLPAPVTQENIGAVRAPPPQAFPGDEFPIPDRWRLVEAVGVHENLLDPYNQNTLKGDRPIPLGRLPEWLPINGDDWFIVLNAVSDTVVEPRSFPTPVGVQTTTEPDSLDVFGHADSLVLAQTFITGFALIKGNTAYRPPDVEYRVTLATQFNYVDVNERRILFVQPSRPSHRFDWFTGVQELFIDYHIRNTSRRYDFDSVRVGIQPFNADFRGFLFQDNQLGVRLFGTRDNNRLQYNLAAFMRLEKDTNSGLNDIFATPRSDFVFHANLFRQDLPFPGLTSQFSVTYNMNRERTDVEIDDNGFPVRPALLGSLRGRNYDVVYLGYNADGRIGRLNFTGSAYLALGEDRNSFFTDQPADIFAYFGAAEISYDVDWMRFRLSGLYASGDGNPYDDTERGFDAIFENPIFAGADTSYWIRQVIPFAGGGRAIGVNGRNGILNSLRSSKEQGQSNFNNPGTMLIGLGADFDITPQFRLSANANHLWFEDTSTLQNLRNEGSVPRSIGYDLSAAAIYRPLATQNLVFRLSGAVFEASAGFSDLFAQDRRSGTYYSVLFNAILTY